MSCKFKNGNADQFDCRNVASTDPFNATEINMVSPGESCGLLGNNRSSEDNDHFENLFSFFVRRPQVVS